MVHCNMPTCSEDSEDGECRPQHDADRISGGDKANGTTGDEDGFSSDDMDDYGYKNHVDDDDENSECEPDDADNALGPEDGEGEGDKTYLLGFVAL